jgi:lambda family phage portal protein
MALEPLNLTPIRHELMAAALQTPPRSSAKRDISMPPQLLAALQSGGFKAAGFNRLTMDWATSILSADQELFSDLRRLRGRSRALAKNNHYASKFLRQVEKNVVGECGITFQAKVKKQRGEGLLDKINGTIEEAFADWSEKDNCSVDGKMSWSALQRFFIRNVAMDGEVFLRKVPLPGNPHLFALQFIDPDQVDPTFFIERLQNGNEIRMGVEVDQYHRTVAYWIWNRHPSEQTSNPQSRVRVPASEIIHAFIPLRVNQTRGIPWMTPSMLEMNMLVGYKEAEVVAARVAASKMGFFTSQTGEQYTGDANLSASNVDSNLQPNMGPQLMDAQPGTFESLPAGMSFEKWDPQHPNASYDAFCKGSLRGIASGLDVSYHGLANDLEGVNFSSIRAGLLEERDTWRLLQYWLIDTLCMPVYRSWLPNSIVAGALSLDASNIAQYAKSVVWHPRGWDWVDPLKDVQASTLMVQNGFSTYTAELGARGLDFEEVMAQKAEEKKVLAKLGLQLGTDIKGVADTATDDQKDPNAQDETAESDTPAKSQQQKRLRASGWKLAPKPRI